MPLEIPPLVLSLVVVPFIGFMVFMKWRSSTSRKAKIRKLLLLAAEEAGKAEAAAASDYINSSIMLDKLNQCAVCFSPSTSRCSRCKAVRYCSGKCQIVHWRKGHKQDCKLPDSSKPDSLTFLNTKENKFFDLNIQETGTYSTVGQRLGPISARIAEIPTSDRTNVLITNPRVQKEVSNIEDSTATESTELAVFTVQPQVHNPCIKLSSSISTNVPPKASLVNDIPGCESPFPDVCRTCAEAIPNCASSDSGSGSEGSIHSSENFVLHAPSFADAVNVIPCSSATTFNIGNSLTCDLPASTRLVNNLTGSLVSEHELNMTSSFTNDFYSTSRSSTDLNRDNPGKNSNTKNKLHDLPLEPSSSTNNHILDTVVSENSMPNIDSGISLLDVPSLINSDSNIVSFGISSLSAPHLKSYTSSCSESSLIISDTGSSSLFNIIKFENQEPNESDTKISPDEIRGPNTSMYNGIRKRSSETDVHCSCPQKEWASGYSFSSQDVCSIEEESVAVHHPHPAIHGLKRSKKKSAQLPISAEASTAETAERINKRLVKPTELLFPYEYFAKLFNWDSLELPPRGLINCGNSCFANVVLQCLTYTRPLAAYLLHGSHSEKCKRIDWCFMCELEHLVSRVRGGEGALSPIRILSRIKSIGNHLGYGRQEDAHEFLRFAIDTMQSICLDEAGGERAVHPIAHGTTFIQQIFGGYLQSKVKCKKCHYESIRYEIMMDLTVEVNGNIKSLEDALRQFATAELLEGENKYKCDRCKSYVKARKLLTVHEAPNILTIALKRFQTGNFGKLNKIVAFPEVLDMSPYMSGTGDNPPLYKLYAVVVHLDVLNASFFGHYICYVKDLKGAWYKIDDSKVNPVAIDAVMSEGAYMLFYSRSTPRPPAVIQDGKAPHFKAVPVNHSVCDSKQSLLLNEHDGEASVHLNQFPSLVFSRAASIEISQPSKVEDLENCAMDIDRIPDKLSTSDYKCDRLFPIMTERNKNLIPRESRDLTSSDAGSLFSGSDETSCSTDSNSDSISTADLAETIYGDPKHLACGSFNMTEMGGSSCSLSCMESSRCPTETDKVFGNKSIKCSPETDAILENDAILSDQSLLNQGFGNRRIGHRLSPLSNKHAVDSDNLPPSTGDSSNRLFCQASAHSFVSELSQRRDMLGFNDSTINRQGCFPQSSQHCSVPESLDCSKDETAKWKHINGEHKAEETKRLIFQPPSRACSTATKFEHCLANDPRTSALPTLHSLGFER